MLYLCEQHIPCYTCVINTFYVVPTATAPISYTSEGNAATYASCNRHRTARWTSKRIGPACSRRSPLRQHGSSHYRIVLSDSLRGRRMWWKAKFRGNKCTMVCIQLLSSHFISIELTREDTMVIHMCSASYKWYNHTFIHVPCRV